MGKMTNAVQQRFIESCHWLIDEKKVNVITGDCGFMVYFQEAALSIAKSKPVCFVMSSLLQLKSIQATLSPNDEIFVLTANGVALGNMAPAFEAACGFSIVDPRVKIVGCEDVPGFQAVADGGKVDVAKVDPGIVALVNDKLKTNPKVKAIFGVHRTASVRKLAPSEHRSPSLGCDLGLQLRRLLLLERAQIRQTGLASWLGWRTGCIQVW